MTDFAIIRCVKCRRIRFIFYGHIPLKRVGGCTHMEEERNLYFSGNSNPQKVKILKSSYTSKVNQVKSTNSLFRGVRGTKEGKMSP